MKTKTKLFLILIAILFYIGCSDNTISNDIKVSDRPENKTTTAYLVVVQGYTTGGINIFEYYIEQPTTQIGHFTTSGYNPPDGQIGTCIGVFFVYDLINLTLTYKVLLNGHAIQKNYVTGNGTNRLYLDYNTIYDLEITLE